MEFVAFKNQEMEILCGPQGSYNDHINVVNGLHDARSITMGRILPFSSNLGL